MSFLSTITVLTLATVSAAATLANPSLISLKHYKHTANRGTVHWLNQHLVAKHFSNDNPALLRNDLFVSSRQLGLNVDPCSQDSDCAGERKCYELILTLDGTAGAKCPFFSLPDACVCLPENVSDLICTRSKDCEKGETCGALPALGDANICISKSFGNDGDGLTGEECSTHAECMLPRRCLDIGTVKICIPSTSDSCRSNSDCDAGEVCKIEPYLAEDIPFCISKDADLPSTISVSSQLPSVSPIPIPTPSSASSPTESRTPSVSPLPSSDENGPSPSPSPTQDPEPSGGLTFDLCESTSDCRGSRECRNVETNNECNGGDCRCIGLVLCETDDDCTNGESCMNPRDLGFEISNDAQICISRSAEPAVCIGAHALKHLPREELVFEHDALANVLCDMNDSCATPGHMVVYKGRALMMKSYCMMTVCVRKVLRVNSPKYSRGLTIPSQTRDLVFTAFAARFETLAEEGVLSVAVRLRL